MKKNFLLSIALLASAIVSAQPAPSSFEQTWKAGPDRSLRNGVIYQVYPSSYKDSDGNGIGDIQGVISKLDYIESLGVSVIWFNPLFVSGWIDGGYDVIDSYRVDQRFGTNNDFVELIQKAPRQETISRRGAWPEHRRTGTGPGHQASGPFGKGTRISHSIDISNLQKITCIILRNLFGLYLSSVMCHRHTPSSKKRSILENILLI